MRWWEHDGDPYDGYFVEFTKQEFEEVLKDHGLWLESKGVEGKRADFRKRTVGDVEEISLLRGLDLRNADLRDSGWFTALVDDSTFAGADFRGADIEGAMFTRCDLSNCNLDVHDMDAASFPGCNLDGAVFPDYINDPSSWGNPPPSKPS